MFLKVFNTDRCRSSWLILAIGFYAKHGIKLKYCPIRFPKNTLRAISIKALGFILGILQTKSNLEIRLQSVSSTSA